MVLFLCRCNHSDLRCASFNKAPTDQSKRALPVVGFWMKTIPMGQSAGVEWWRLDKSAQVTMAAPCSTSVMETLQQLHYSGRPFSPHLLWPSVTPADLNQWSLSPFFPAFNKSLQSNSPGRLNKNAVVCCSLRLRLTANTRWQVATHRTFNLMSYMLLVHVNGGCFSHTLDKFIHSSIHKISSNPINIHWIPKTLACSPFWQICQLMKRCIPSDIKPLEIN